MAEENLWQLLAEALRQIAQEVVYLTPKIFIALIVFAIALVLIKVVNIPLRRILKFAELDQMIQKLTGFSLPFTLNSLLIFLADLGIALIALLTVVSLFLEAQYVQVVTEGLYYVARIVSIIVITIFLFSIFSAIISRIQVETRLRAYTLFIILLLVTAMLVDITALSEGVKNALITGLSVGVGVSVGVFAVWFFFHDYLDKIFLGKTASQKEEEEKSQNTA